MFLIVDIIHFPEGDGVVVSLDARPAPGDGVVVVPLVQNLVSLPCAQSVSVVAAVERSAILLKLGIIIKASQSFLLRKPFVLFLTLITCY